MSLKESLWGQFETHSFACFFSVMHTKKELLEPVLYVLVNIIIFWLRDIGAPVKMLLSSKRIYAYDAVNTSQH